MSTNTTNTDNADAIANQTQVDTIPDTDTNKPTNIDAAASVTASAFSNYLNLFNVEGTFLYWISDLHFMGDVDNSNRAIGYTGHMIRLFLRPGFEDDVKGQGGEVPPFYEWVASSSNTFNAVLHGISAV